MEPVDLFWTEAGNIVLALGCVAGLVLFAWRTRGRMRLLGVIGTALLFAVPLFGVASVGFGVMATEPGSALNPLLVTVVSAVLNGAGLVLIGLAVAVHRPEAMTREAPVGGLR